MIKERGRLISDYWSPSYILESFRNTTLNSITGRICIASLLDERTYILGSIWVGLPVARTIDVSADTILFASSQLHPWSPLPADLSRTLRISMSHWDVLHFVPLIPALPTLPNLGELHYHAFTFSNLLTSFNIIHLAVYKEPLTFAAGSFNLLIIK